MKLLLILALAVFALAHAEEEVEHEYMLFPDGDGVPHLIDLKEKYEEPTPEETERNVNTITFNLFTRSNRHNRQVLTLNNLASVTNSHFRNTRETRFITHGWRSGQNSAACTRPRDAYLNAGDYNVIVIDWSSIAGTSYTSAASNVRSVGARVSQFINFMRAQAGLNLGRTILVGHSLGGHVAGIAGHLTAGTVRGVVALDPAMPSFNSAGAGAGIHHNDGAHVQVIHTNGGMLGLMRPAGNSDWYPNGGQVQPGCGLDASGACAHSRAYLFFAESIGNPRAFRATGANNPPNTFMGGRVLTNAHGRFELRTRANAPFGMG